MTKAELLALDAVADEPLAKVRELKPDLYAKLTGALAEERKTRLAAAFAGTPAKVRAAVAAINPQLLADPAIPANADKVQKTADPDA